MTEPKKILLVGRARDAIDAMVQRSLGEQVLWAEATDLDQATDLMVTERYAALLLDVEDPTVDFAALAQELSTQSNKPGLVLVSEANNAYLSEIRTTALALSLNVFATVTRPVSVAEMQGALDAMVSGAGTAGGEPALTETEFMQGLVSDGLSPIFQPKLNLRDAKLQEAETYARWITASGATLGAGTVVGFAKAAGHMSVLTYRMLELAVQQQAQWRKQGLDIAVSVNVPGETLYREDFLEVLNGLCAQHESKPSKLRLNITESELSLDADQRFSVLEAIREAGFGLALDDFGGGYATLLALPSIPFDELIVDRVFVRRAEEGKNGKIILESAINLSAQLGMRVTCEGVETVEQLTLVAALGADCGLGYHIGKPMPADDFLIWAEDFKAGVMTIPGCAPKG